MSDSLPPDGGPGPFDGWDLEGMLSGENVWLPDGMRPVARTLAALRSAPMRAELADEAAARAAFRDIMPAGRGGPAQAGRDPGDAHTLILPAPAPDTVLPAPAPAPARSLGASARPRPRHAHRRPPQRGRWGSKALLGAVGGAAAVVIVGGVALAGGFSGVGGQQGLLGHNAGATSAAPQTSIAGSNGVEGTAAKEPTASPSPSRTAGQQSAGGSGATSGPSALCRQYLEFFEHSKSQSDRAAENGDFQQLSQLAGGPWHVIGYCMGLQPWALTPKQPESYSDGIGVSPPGSQGQAKSGQQSGDAGDGATGNGAGSGQNAAGPGQGTQNQP